VPLIAALAGGVDVNQSEVEIVWVFVVIGVAKAI
jgi:hypothetical protein